MKAAIIKGLALGAVAIATTCSAWADTLVYTGHDIGYPRPNGQFDYGQGTLTMGRPTLDFFDATKLSVGSAYPSEALVTRDQDGFYMNAEVKNPVNQVLVDSDTHAVFAMSSQGGLSFTTQRIKNLSSGGSLQITDMNADLKTGIIHATLSGGNGVGSLQNVAVWTIGAISATSTITGHNSCPNLGSYGCDYFGAEEFDQVDVRVLMSNLSLTPQAQAAFRQGLGLLTFGNAALDYVLQNQDNTTLSMTTHFELPVGFNLTAVPEPGTWALMGLGLVGMGLASRRRMATRA